MSSNDPPQSQRFSCIERALSSWAGDIKKLTNHSPEYRMRSGNWRILFEIEEEKIVIYRILDRKDAY